MNELEIFYNVQNGGDGSAYPRFFESQRLAEFDEKYAYEGWAEESVNCITIKGDNLLCDEIELEVSYYLELFFEMWDIDGLNKFKEYAKEFYPDVLPKFTTSIINEKEYGVFYGGKLIYQKYDYPDYKAEESRCVELQEKLNNIVLDNLTIG